MKKLFITLFLTSLISIVSVGKAASESLVTPGTIKGTVQALAGGQSTAIAGATLTLINKATPKLPYKTTSNNVGGFIFTNLPIGDYTLTVEATGLSSVSKDIKLTSGAVLTIDLGLTVTIGETVTVRIEEGLLSTSETSISNVIRSETLNTKPFHTESFQNAIALTPGVVRDGKGRNYLKGTREGQSGYNVNGADVTDPVSGKLAFEIPLEAAETIRVEETPYSAEYGQFTGGVTNLQTKGGTDKFKISAARFFPTFRNLSSTKINSFRPRLTLSGPLVKERFHYLQSFEYRFSNDRVPNLPKSANNITIEGLSSFTQFDWVVNKNNNLKFNFALFPRKIRNVNLDTFNPSKTSSNYKQRGFLVSVSEQAVFRDASFLSTEFSYKTFDVDVFGKSNDPFEITPEANRGSYFANTQRNTTRWNWREIYYLRPLNFRGQHSLKLGAEVFSTGVKGKLDYRPISIRRLDDTLAQRIEFKSDMPLGYAYRETNAFVQDRWTINSKATLDFGLRFDRDGVARQSNFSPRISFLYSPGKKGRTVIRGGIGIFYDRSSGIAGIFENEANSEVQGNLPESSELAEIMPNYEQIPRRIVTNFAADGNSIVGNAREYTPQRAGQFLTPKSFRWSVQVDQGITKNLNVRFGYLKRTGSKDLVFEPKAIDTAKGIISLTSNGRSKYDEFQFVATYKKPSLGQWNVSYVFSHTKGDLNTADKFYNDNPALVLRRNEFAPLSFDTPHRFLLYGQIDFKHDIRIGPLFEMRSGFPYSALNERLNFIGKRNLAGRFPRYLALDVQITKGIKLPFFDKKRARIGVALLNLTNHFNPRDVQRNFTSPNFGRFYNSLGTEVKGKFDLEF